MKSNEQRDKKQEERENNYQSVIEKLTEKYQILWNDKTAIISIGRLLGVISARNR